MSAADQPEAATAVAQAVDAAVPSVVNTVSDGVSTDATKSEGGGNGKAGKVENKQRKHRRERLPLPDPIPETPVKRYAEPSKDELQKKIDEHDKVIRDCFDKLAASRAFFEKRQKIRDASKDSFEAARKRMNDKNDELRGLFEQRKNMTSQIKELRESNLNARNDMATPSNSREAEALKGLKSVEEVDQRIKELEYMLSAESLPLKREKVVIQQIAYLRHTGRNIILGKDQAFQQEKQAKQARMTKRTELEGLRKELDKKIDTTKADLEQRRKAVDEIRQNQDAEIDKLAEETKGIDRDKVKEKINEEKSAIRHLREEFNVALDKWYLNERIAVEQQKIARRKKWEAQNAEREARRKKWEEEQAQYPEPDPYQKEKDMCQSLVSYLQGILGEEVEKSVPKPLLLKTGSAPTLKNPEDKAARTISSTGKAIGKSKNNKDGFESLAFSGFMEKKQKGKGKKGRRSSVAIGTGESTDSTDDTLKKQPLDIIAAFTHLELTPPSKKSEVRGALEEVKKKKDYYDSDPAPPKPETTNKETNPRPKAAPKIAPKPNGKTLASDMSAGSGAFPGLNGSTEVSKPTTGADSSRPSFSDIAKGSAIAPANPNPFGEGMIDEVVDEGGMPGNHESGVGAQPIAFTES